MPGKVKALSFAIIEVGPDDAGHFQLLAASEVCDRRGRK